MQILSALKQLPTLRQWTECGALIVLFGLLAVMVMPELIDVANRPALPNMFAIAAITFVVPAFCEELVFRGLLTPRFSATWTVVSTSLFVAWHPLETLFLLPAARDLFTNLTFLGLVALLGIICWLAYFRSKSLWSSVFIHWVIVVGWKALGGAQFLQ